jgi:hypothetical protein
MKKTFLLLSLLFITYFSFAQADSSKTKNKRSLSDFWKRYIKQTDSTYHRLSVDGEIRLITFPLGNNNITKGYGSYFGFEGIDMVYHFSRSFAIDVHAEINIDSIPMIDQKDYIKNKYPNKYNIYYSYTGGNIGFLAEFIDFRYDIINHNRFDFFILAGAGMCALDKSPIKGYDVRSTSAPVQLIESESYESALGLRFGIGSSFKISKHFNALAETSVEAAMAHKVNDGPIIQWPIYIGIAYGF